MTKGMVRVKMMLMTMKKALKMKMLHQHLQLHQHRDQVCLLLLQRLQQQWQGCRVSSSRVQQRARG